MADALAAKLQASARGMQTRIQNRRASTPAIMQKTQERPNANAGNAIRVRVRVRPLGDGRGALREKLQVDKQRGVITIGDQGQGGSSQSSSTFAFDTVYESEDNQAVFEHVGRPIIENLMLGFNGTLFAYGQTGSGKTFTIGEISQLGTACEGVAHRMIRALFSPPTGEAAGSKPTSFAVQYVQIYVEKVYDLLPEEATKGEGPPLQLREDKQNGVFVAGATTNPVSSAEECLALLKRGAQRLSFAATQMNRHSSRSHAVCRVFVETDLGGTGGDYAAGANGNALGTNAGSATDAASLRDKNIRDLSAHITKAARASGHAQAILTLCDLAGSEDVGRSGATGQSLSEAKKINSSLLALGNVINALSKEGGPAGHVPYRDSVLTRILQQSIGGNARTSLVVCVSPADSDVTETLSSLRFASRAKRVINVDQANVTISATELSAQADELAMSLQKQLETAERALEGARDKCEQRAIQALQLAVRMSSKTRQVERMVAQQRARAVSAVQLAVRFKHKSKQAEAAEAEAKVVRAEAEESKRAAHLAQRKAEEAEAAMKLELMATAKEREKERQESTEQRKAEEKRAELAAEKAVEVERVRKEEMAVLRAKVEEGEAQVQAARTELQKLKRHVAEVEESTAREVDEAREQKRRQVAEVEGRAEMAASIAREQVDSLDDLTRELHLSYSRHKAALRARTHAIETMQERERQAISAKLAAESAVAVAQADAEVALNTSSELRTALKASALRNEEAMSQAQSELDDWRVQQAKAWREQQVRAHDVNDALAEKNASFKREMLALKESHGQQVLELKAVAYRRESALKSQVNQMQVEVEASKATAALQTARGTIRMETPVHAKLSAVRNQLAVSSAATRSPVRAHCQQIAPMIRASSVTQSDLVGELLRSAARPPAREDELERAKAQAELELQEATEAYQRETESLQDELNKMAIVQREAEEAKKTAEASMMVADATAKELQDKLNAAMLDAKMWQDECNTLRAALANKAQETSALPSSRSVREEMEAAPTRAPPWGPTYQPANHTFPPEDAVPPTPLPLRPSSGIPPPNTHAHTIMFRPTPEMEELMKAVAVQAVSEYAASTGVSPRPQGHAEWLSSRQPTGGPIANNMAEIVAPHGSPNVRWSQSVGISSPSTPYRSYADAEGPPAHASQVPSTPPHRTSPGAGSAGSLVSSSGLPIHPRSLDQSSPVSGAAASRIKELALASARRPYCPTYSSRTPHQILHEGSSFGY